jgi:hypothetical protein
MCVVEKYHGAAGPVGVGRWRFVAVVLDCAAER